MKDVRPWQVMSFEGRRVGSGTQKISAENTSAKKRVGKKGRNDRNTRNARRIESKVKLQDTLRFCKISLQFCKSSYEEL